MQPQKPIDQQGNQPQTYSRAQVYQIIAPFMGMIVVLLVLAITTNIQLNKDKNVLESWSEIIRTKSNCQSCLDVGQEYIVGQKEIGVEHLLNVRTNEGFAEHRFLIRDPPTQAPYVECEFTDKLSLNKRFTLDYVFGFNKTILRVEDLACMEAHPNLKFNESCADVITTQGPALYKITKTFNDEPKPIARPVVISPSITGETENGKPELPDKFKKVNGV